MEYTHLVHAYYDLRNDLNDNRNSKPINRNDANAKFAKFYASNLKQDDKYVTFESWNAWDQWISSRFSIANVVEIEEL